MSYHISRVILPICLSFPILLSGVQKESIVHLGIDLPYQPWFTGPFLTPTPINMELGKPAIEPSITVFWNYGVYTDDWEFKAEDQSITINPYLDFQFALTERTGVEIQAQSFTTIRDGISSTSFGDTNILFGYQVSNDQKASWIPDFRFMLETIFPTGKYDRLDPRKKLDDVTGQGAFFLGPNLAFQKLFYLPENFFILHWAVGYFFPGKAKVKGFSLYGGGEGTKGRIRPGQFLTAFIAGEYSLSQKWVLGFETEFLYQLSSSKFRGKLGVKSDGSPAAIGLPALAQWIFLPEVQYNFNAHSGLLFGGWFSLIGKNTRATAAGFISFLYVF